VQIACAVTVMVLPAPRLAIPTTPIAVHVVAPDA